MDDGSTSTVGCGVEGVGLGLRYDLAERLFRDAPASVRWVEIHPENYMSRGGRYAALLEQALDRYPVVTHGLTMGFGALQPAEPAYRDALKHLLRRVRTPWHSDHLCFCDAEGVMLHDLLPLPFCREAIEVATRRIAEARDGLELPIAVENVSYYAHPGAPQMDEVDFLLEVLHAADAKLLLDVNNVFVNSMNHGFDARAYIDRIPADRVVQLHVAGHQVRHDGLIIDTHGEAVREEVYALLEHTLERLGPVPVLLERDQSFPPFEALLEEVERLDAIYQRATRRWHASPAGAAASGAPVASCH